MEVRMECLKLASILAQSKAVPVGEVQKIADSYFAWVDETDTPLVSASYGADFVARKVA
jgi:hypothetical protein